MAAEISDERIEYAAKQAARRCLWTIEAVLMECEHADAQEEFFTHIHEEILALLRGTEAHASGDNPQ